MVTEVVVVAAMEVEDATDGKNVCATTVRNSGTLRETAGYQEEVHIKIAETMQTQARKEILCLEQIVMQSPVLLEAVNLSSRHYKMGLKWCGVDRAQSGGNHLTSGHVTGSNTGDGGEGAGAGVDDGDDAREADVGSLAGMTDEDESVEVEGGSFARLRLAGLI